MSVAASDKALLAAVKPTLVRAPKGFRAAPRATQAFFSPSAVRRLVASGHLAWGNASRSFVTLTDAGRQAVSP